MSDAFSTSLFARRKRFAARVSGTDRSVRSASSPLTCRCRQLLRARNFHAAEGVEVPAAIEVIVEGVVPDAMDLPAVTTGAGVVLSCDRSA